VKKDKVEAEYTEEPIDGEMAPMEAMENGFLGEMMEEDLLREAQSQEGGKQRHARGGMLRGLLGGLGGRAAMPKITDERRKDVDADCEGAVLGHDVLLVSCRGVVVVSWGWPPGDLRRSTAPSCPNGSALRHSAFAFEAIGSLFRTRARASERKTKKQRKPSENPALSYVKKF